MKTNRAMTILGSATLMSLVTSTAAFAAAPTNKVYSSGLLVLVFLGFCALVVVAQLIPAMISLYGMIKGAVEARKMAVSESRTK